MTTLRRESSSFNTQRRDSLTQARTRSRPKLLRSNATEPSITAPKAIKGSLVSPRSPRTATDMLNKVAVYPTTTGILGSSPAPETLSVHAKPIVFMTSGHTQPCDSQDAALSSSPRFGSSVQSF